MPSSRPSWSSPTGFPPCRAWHPRRCSPPRPAPGPSAGWSFREREPEQEGESLFGRMAEPSEFPGREAVPGDIPSGESGPRFLGQMASGYLVFETEDGLAVMDPHAAHERIEYERTRQLSGMSATVQRCAVPLPLPPSLSASVREHEDALRSVGFLFSDRDGSLSLEAFPALPGSGADDPVRLLRALLLEWDEDRQRPLGDILWKRLATAACGMAVKLGDAMEPAECIALWRELLACVSPWSCPHGRPTVLSLSKEKLESFFGRE